MALREFECKACNHKYDELAPYDETGVYPGVICPKCGSDKKDKLMSLFSLSGTYSRNEIFSNKAGRLMEKAKQERRDFEAKDHMGPNPYPEIDDTQQYDEGVHHPFPMSKNVDLDLPPV